MTSSAHVLLWCCWMNGDSCLVELYQMQTLSSIRAAVLLHKRVSLYYIDEITRSSKPLSMSTYSTVACLMLGGRCQDSRFNVRTTTRENRRCQDIFWKRQSHNEVILNCRHGVADAFASIVDSPEPHSTPQHNGKNKRKSSSFPSGNMDDCLRFHERKGL